MAKKKSVTVEFTDVAHNVWLAGLGALATAGDEGERLFKTLVTRGEKVEKRVQRKRPGKHLSGAVQTVRDRAGETFGSIQATIDDGVASALHRLGVPTRTEIAALSRRVEKLTRSVNGGKSVRKKAARKRKAAPRRATKKAAS